MRNAYKNPSSPVYKAVADDIWNKASHTWLISDLKNFTDFSIQCVKLATAKLGIA